ncbi:MAG: iron-sulfur cluster insertion protein ErpA [Gammaproteobacteria bacterium]
MNAATQATNLHDINTQDNALITVTDSAALKVWELMEEENNLNLKLRVYIEGGGCSGFQYGFTFDEVVNEDDTQVEKSVTTGDKKITVILLVDAMSLQYLGGAEIDYKDDVEGERFIIRNPNAKTTCGCGSSFSTE